MYSDLVLRAQSVVTMLGPEERADAERVLQLASGAPFEHGGAQRAADVADRSEGLELRRELGRLVEVLSRRGAKAVPVATLGRALLAELAGDAKSAVQLRRECDTNLALFGF